MTKKIIIGNKGLSFGFVILVGTLLIGCLDSRSMMEPSPDPARMSGPLPATATPQACWGQATQVFARMGEMGVHSSQQPTPRIGLRNLARALFNDGVLPDDSLQALGAFVADALGLSIDACL